MFSENLKEALETKEISAFKMSKETSIPVSTIYDWIHDRTMPSSEALYKVAKYLERSMESLLD